MFNLLGNLKYIEKNTKRTTINKSKIKEGINLFEKKGIYKKRNSIKRS